jgi:hypothetical protein
MTIFFIVRAPISDPAKRAAFDAWYCKAHLPDAVGRWDTEGSAVAERGQSCAT